MPTLLHLRRVSATFFRSAQPTREGFTMFLTHVSRSKITYPIRTLFSRVRGGWAIAGLVVLSAAFVGAISDASSAAASPAAPTRSIAVHVLVARWHGAPPTDEGGPWAFSDAPVIVANLNAATHDVGLTFKLENVEAVDVGNERLARVPATSEEATAAINWYVATGKVSTEALTVVVVGLNPTTWVQGWGNQDQPLRTSGAWPVIIASTRVAKSSESHYIAHEFGHVMGLFDTTFDEQMPRRNIPYTRCGLALSSTTLPREGAPPGAKQNVMSYDVKERRSFLSDDVHGGYRTIIDCWVRQSGL